ncbi:MAG: hypothetical protein IJO14_09500 [Clostridia bacterium]|nr:hypothetical protein [Clostridia bacterium]
MFFKRSVIVFVIISMVFILCSCSDSEQSHPTEPTEPTTAYVNNIYITPDGIVTNVSQIQDTTLSTQVTTPVAADSTQPQTESVQTTITEEQLIPTVVSGSDVSQLSAEDILAVIANTVNEAKEKTDFSAHLLQQVTINLTDCTLSWAVPVINTAIGVFNGPHTNEYEFVNGLSLDPKEDFKSQVTPFSAIPPSDRLFSLESEGIVNATAYRENGENVYSVTIVPEYTDSQVLVPVFHAQALDYLDLSDFDFGIGEITDAVCNYPGATITIHTDQDGKLLKYEEMIPMNGSGTGKLGISLSASFEGNMYECWTFEW